MTKEQIIKLIEEAQHSHKILMRYVGTVDSMANMLLLKWPDVLLSYVKEEEIFEEEMCKLVCVPLRILAESLQLMTKSESNEIHELMLFCVKDPVGTKRSLIRFCNNQIHKANQMGRKIPEID
jgi:hypothetical protein